MSKSFRELVKSAAYLYMEISRPSGFGDDFEKTTWAGHAFGRYVLRFFR